MSKKLTVGELIERGGENRFNETQQEIFAGVIAMLNLLLDEAEFKRVLDNPTTSESVRNMLIRHILVSPLPRGIGPWPKSDADKNHAASLKDEANALYKQRREDSHETETADASWQYVVGEIKRLHRKADDPLKAALKVKPREGREEWEALRDRWYGR